MIKNKSKIYWNYFKYIVEHKKNVFIECLKMGMFLHALTHDVSKFLPSEFIPYSIKFFSGDYAYKYFEVERKFSEAWLHHQHRNRHHWNYWVDPISGPIPMPNKYIRQMIADWRGMSRKFGDSAESYYEKNKHKMKLHPKTVETLELILSIKN
jgi:hypothetical protein